MLKKIIVSASRRTDLPAFYSDWLIDRFRQGFVEVINPYNQNINTVSLSVEYVHSFDPIVHWKEGRAIKNNLASYETIIKKAANSGITKVKTSFMNTHYRKLNKRGFHFVELDNEKKKDIAWELGRIANNYNVILQFCCNDFLFEDEDIPYIEKSCCIDGNYISKIVGEPTILKKDPSQRKECNCTYSRDIGNYTQRCYHSCLYCYANPSKDTAI